MESLSVPPRLRLVFTCPPCCAGGTWTPAAEVVETCTRLAAPFGTFRTPSVSPPRPTNRMTFSDQGAPRCFWLAFTLTAIRMSNVQEDRKTRIPRTPRRLAGDTRAVAGASCAWGNDELEQLMAEYERGEVAPCLLIPAKVWDALGRQITVKPGDGKGRYSRRPNPRNSNYIYGRNCPEKASQSLKLEHCGTRSRIG